TGFSALDWIRVATSAGLIRAVVGMSVEDWAWARDAGPPIISTRTTRVLNASFLFMERLRAPAAPNFAIAWLRLYLWLMRCHAERGLQSESKHPYSQMFCPG